LLSRKRTASKSNRIFNDGDLTMKASEDLIFCKKNKFRIGSLLRTRTAKEVAEKLGVSSMILGKFIERTDLSPNKIREEHALKRVKRLTLKKTSLQIVEQTGYSRTKVYYLLRKIREQRKNEILFRKKIT